MFAYFEGYSVYDIHISLFTKSEFNLNFILIVLQELWNYKQFNLIKNVFKPFGRPVYQTSISLWGPKNTFQVLFFQL